MATPVEQTEYLSGAHLAIRLPAPLPHSISTRTPVVLVLLKAVPAD